MAKIIPFKAVRPTRDKVSLIAARSYDMYTPEQRDARLRDNPFSFLHIVNPGYKYSQVTSGKKRYKLVRNRYQEFKEDGVFMQEETPSFYVYKIVNRDGLEFKGIIAAASTQDYERDIIKKHEDTLEYKEKIFVKYLKTVGFNAEPVLLTYPDHEGLSLIIKSVMETRAEYEFTTTYKDTHYVWPLSESGLISEISEAFNSMPNIYIADGHHRSSSSYLLSQKMQDENEQHTGEEPYNYFMSYLIPESDLKIYEFNRLIKDLNGLSKDDFLVQLDEWFRIENREQNFYKPSKKHHFSMYLDGDFYSLYLRKDYYEIHNSLDALDTHILYKLVLNPILGIKDVRNDTRIAYADGKKDMAYVKTVVDKVDFAVGFGMLPVTTEEMKQIADEGLKMPPKSTYIEPKLRSGITIYEF
ncbi:MAG: hypothetical protein ACI849_000521 [Patiriisocius sp.]|jgi:uncharacterized protein (DUF1015 family)